MATLLSPFKMKMSLGVKNVITPTQKQKKIKKYIDKFLLVCCCIYSVALVLCFNCGLIDFIFVQNVAQKHNLTKTQNIERKITKANIILMVICVK